MTRKALFLIDSLGVGGAERSVLQIAERLPTWDRVVCHLYRDDSLLRNVPAPSFDVVSLGFAGRRPGPGLLLRLWAFVRREKPSVILVTGSVSAVFGALVGRLTRTPVVHTFTNEAFTDAHYASVPPASRWKLSVLRRVYRTCLGRRPLVIAVSESVRDTNCRTVGIAPSRVRVIHRGRDPEAYRRLPDVERVEARARLGLESDAPVILDVARLLGRKGHRDLLHAMRRVADELPGATLLLAGAGPDRADFEALADRLGLAHRARFLGSRGDIPELLGLADLFAFPSHFEGHPGALLEAMLSSLPIVASDIPVHRATLRDGETGVLVPARDPDALAAAILELLGDPRRARELGRSARRDAVRRFDLDDIARRHEEVFAEALAARSGRFGEETP